jgi:hypothetical protein
LACGCCCVQGEVRDRTDRIQDLTVCRTFDETLGELRVTQAYIELLSISEKGPESRAIPIVRSGSHEIRVFQVSQTSAISEPAIWIELHDHGTGFPIDSCRCGAIDDALAAFKDFVAQVKSL